MKPSFKRVVSLGVLAALAAATLPVWTADAQTPRPGPRKFDTRDIEEEKPDEFGPDSGGGGGSKAPVADSDKPTLSREVVLQRMETAMGGVRKCYEDALKVDGKAQGRVLVTFQIQLDGKVTDAKVKESNFAGAKPETKTNVEQCVLKRVSEIVFPKRSKGKPQTINFPFNLKPKAAQ